MKEFLKELDKMVLHGPPGCETGGIRMTCIWFGYPVSSAIFYFVLPSIFGVQ